MCTRQAGDVKRLLVRREEFQLKTSSGLNTDRTMSLHPSLTVCTRFQWSARCQGNVVTWSITSAVPTRVHGQDSSSGL